MFIYTSKTVCIYHINKQSKQNFISYKQTVKVAHQIYSLNIYSDQKRQHEGNSKEMSFALDSDISLDEIVGNSFQIKIKLRVMTYDHNLTLKLM